MLQLSALILQPSGNSGSTAAPWQPPYFPRAAGGCRQERVGQGSPGSPPSPLPVFATVALHLPTKAGLKEFPGGHHVWDMSHPWDNALLGSPEGGQLAGGGQDTHINPQDVGAGTAPTPG